MLCYTDTAMIYTHIEYTRKKALCFETAVVGGGLAGLCAAIASARHGAKTVLIQNRPVLGGNASGEVRMHVVGASENSKKPEYEEGGILYELMLANKHRNDSFNFSVWDMTLWEAAKAEPNLTLLLNTAMTGCTTDGNRITGIECVGLTNEMHYTVRADIFVDATGLGTLAELSGADFSVGSEGKAAYGEPDAPDEPNFDRMGNTLLFKAVDRGHPVKYEPPAFARHFTEEELKYRVHASNHAEAITTDKGKSDYVRLTSFSTSSVDYGYWWLELNGETDDFIGEYESISEALYACIWGIWDHIKNGGGHGAENWELEWVGALPGMREGRRVLGDYVLNENDLLANRTFPDGVCYGGWAMDNHTPGGLLDFDKRPSTIFSFDGIYEIPYRCYYSRNIANLMTAGRIVSASKLAMSSLRVMGTCAAGGQAVGTAAALCVKKQIDPRGLLPYVDELRLILSREDCYLPGLTGHDPDDLMPSALLEASSERPGFEAELVRNGAARPVGGNNLWASDGIREEGERLSVRFGAPVPVDRVILTFDTDFRYAIKITLSDKRRAQQRIGTPPELVRDYAVRLMKDGAVAAERSVTGNFQRLNTLCFDGVLCDAAELVFTASNGAPDIRVYELRILQKR